MASASQKVMHGCCLQAAQDAQVLGGPTGAVRHASTPLPGARAGPAPAPFDPSAVFGAAAAQSFDKPWPGPSGDAAGGSPYERAPSGEERGGDSLGALEGGIPGGRGDAGGAGGSVQRRTESEPVAAFARHAPRPVLREFVALGLSHAASAEAAAARWGFGFCVAGLFGGGHRCASTVVVHCLVPERALNQERQPS